ncbi:MAG: hypothetical protein AAF986_08560, partial [Pseudomonadota bacterium]
AGLLTAGILSTRRERLKNWYLVSLFVLALTLGGWACLAAYLSLDGRLSTPSFLGSWPAFWITFIAPTFVLTPIILFRAYRDQTRKLIDHTPAYQFIAFQSLRVLAIGGIYKGLSGEFSLYYALLVGIPDFLYGLSGIFITLKAKKQEISPTLLAAWHLVGAAIILPYGVVLLQMGLAGPWQVFTASPTIATIFEYPIVLAPTVTVPIFVIVNLLVATRIAERKFGLEW